MLDQLIERVIAAGASEELVAARADWDALTGKVFDDDPLYEERTAAFLEWYALERKGADGRVPVERMRTSLAEGDPDRDGLGLLGNTHRSVFVVRRAKEPHLDLDDLLTGCSFRVFERRTPLGLDEGDIFEARLCARSETTGEVLLTRAVQHHPREAREAIEAIAQEGQSHGETLWKLARLRWKAARWGHVAPERIYRGDDAVE
jgi:hypothetical protein